MFADGREGVWLTESLFSGTLVPSPSAFRGHCPEVLAMVPLTFLS